MALESDPTHEGIAPNALDDRDGPAQRLAPSELDAAVEAAVRRALPARGRFPRGRLAALLIAATLCFGGVAAALFGARSSEREQPPPPRDRVGVMPPAEKPRTPAAESPSEPARPPVAPAPMDGVPNARAPSPADLLKQANQLRGKGRWADAERIYSLVASRHAATSQGPVAALAAASLRLEHLGDPRGALDLYKKALRASSLAAEAELGIANSYRALGDRNGEIRALERLDSAYPNAAFHADVRSRLRALEAGKR